MILHDSLTQPPFVKALVTISSSNQVDSHKEPSLPHKFLEKNLEQKFDTVESDKTCARFLALEFMLVWFKLIVLVKNM